MPTLRYLLKARQGEGLRSQNVPVLIGIDVYKQLYTLCYGHGEGFDVNVGRVR